MKIRMTYAIAGVIAGIVTIILGIIFMINPPETFRTHSVDRVTFGGDYYTEEYAATKAAGDNAAIVANNLREIGETNAKYAGTFFIVFGFVLVLVFGEKADLIKNEEKSQFNKPVEKVELPSL